MSDMNISLYDVKTYKTVNIPEIGVFKVRELGSGEGLDLSAKQRRLSKIITELRSTDFTKYDLTDKEQEKEFNELSKHVDALADELAEIKRYEFETYKRCFTDNKKGKLVDELMSILTEEERGALFDQIFHVKPVTVETAETVEASTEDAEDVKDV